MPTEIAYQLLRQHSGTRFDSQIVESFIRYHKKQHGPEVTNGDGRPRRIPCRTNVSLRSNSHAKNGLSEDLSTTGMFVSVAEPVQEGTMIKLHFSLPDADEPPIEAMAKVVWINNSCNKAKPDFPSGNGLLFTKMDPPAEETLYNYIEQRRDALMH